mgnify:CR=1 FL=1
MWANRFPGARRCQPLRSALHRLYGTVLLRIVEAEAGNEDEDGKLLVANVVLNRMDSELLALADVSRFVPRCIVCTELYQ